MHTIFNILRYNQVLNILCIVGYILNIYSKCTAHIILKTFKIICCNREDKASTCCPHRSKIEFSR